MKVLTVGSAMIDTVAVIASDRIEQMTMRNADTSFLLLEEGRKTDALEISTHCGGGAINAAVALSRLGHDVSVLVKLGRDRRADMVLERLHAESIAHRWIGRDEEAPTGASVLISSHDRNAAIFTYRGANSNLVAADIVPDAFGVDLVYLASLSNRSADHFPQLVEHGRAGGAFVAANPGIRQLSAKGGQVLDMLRSIDLLIMNRVEAEALLPPLMATRPGIAPSIAHWPGPDGDLAPQEMRPLTGGGYELSLPAYFAHLERLGLRYGAVTLGRHGAFVHHASQLFFCPASEVERPAGTAGAGDAFASTLSVHLASGEACETAMQAAALNAASVVGHTDTQSGLLTAASLRSRIAGLEGRLRVRRWMLDDTPGNDS